MLAGLPGVTRAFIVMFPDVPKDCDPPPHMTCPVESLTYLQRFSTVS